MMPGTHGANKSNLFAQIFNRYEVTVSEFAQIKPPLIAQILDPYEATPDEICANKACFICSCKHGLRPCTHEQIKHPLFEQILPELLHTDLKFEQKKSIYLLHVYGALAHKHPQINLFFICTVL